MAYIQPHKGGYRVHIRRTGFPAQSRIFPTKRLAQQWAAEVESNLLDRRAGHVPSQTLRQVLDRYMEEVSALKKGSGKEALRVESLIKNFPKLAAKNIDEITTDDWAEWREARLKQVTKGSVQRDISLYRNVFTVAQKEWKIIKESPFVGLRMPGQNPARDRLIQPREVKQICRRLHYVSGQLPKSKSQEVALAFLISLRTGMRAGEVLQLNHNTVDLKRRVAVVTHKTQHLTGKPREVPLSSKAARLLKDFQGFTVSSASLDTLFRKARDSQLIKDIHFHDARATALTHMAKKVDVMTLAKISGHRDLKILLNTYYRVNSSDIAKMLG